jgi:hypothetical protein
VQAVPELRVPGTHCPAQVALKTFQPSHQENISVPPQQYQLRFHWPSIIMPPLLNAELASQRGSTYAL